MTVPTDLDVLAAPRGGAPRTRRRRRPGRLTAGDTVTLGSWDVLVAVTR